MAIKDYWVYQERLCDYPWALYIVKEYDKRISDKASCLDIAYYCELINDKRDNNFSEICVYYETIDEYVAHIAERLGEYVELKESDIRQLQAEISNII